jgi:membrane protease subunit HflK
MSWDWEKLQEQQRKRGGEPPKMEDIVKKFNEIKIPGGALWILVAVVGLLSTGMFYTVRPTEVGLVQRFGKYIRTTPPGLHLKWPAGIETVKKVNVTRIETEEFSGRNALPKDAKAETGNSNLSLMLTGDLNVALVPWVVQYRVKDTEENGPYNYTFKVRDVKQFLRDMSEATMRLVVGDRSIDEVISKRDEIAEESKTLLQKELDHAETGIHIITVELKKTDVPEPVQPSLNEVNQATQEKEQKVYEAREEYNKAIPSAMGEAERVLKAAEGYALDRINRAKGDANKFAALYNEYTKAKDVTRRRLYLESLKELFPKFKQKYVVDEDLKTLLPLLNLGTEKEASK